MQKTYRAKKSLGQNFLKSESALRKIIDAGEISDSDVVLEIGPGKGVLTKRLLASGCQLIAIEKDKDLYELLNIKFQEEISSGKLKLVHGDILEFNLKSYQLKATSYKLIANIPYNITGAILKKFLTAEDQPKRMVLMVQLEVAKRIMARDKKESLLSISVKAYGEPEMVMKVPARYFAPAPKVDSAIISIKNISRETFKKGEVNEENFWKIAHLGFAHKRKKLSGNLKKLIPKEKLSSLSLDNKRAEDLSTSDWLALSKML